MSFYFTYKPIDNDGIEKPVATELLYGYNNMKELIDDYVYGSARLWSESIGTKKIHEVIGMSWQSFREMRRSTEWHNAINACEYDPGMRFDRDKNTLKLPQTGADKKYETPEVVDLRIEVSEGWKLKGDPDVKFKSLDGDSGIAEYDIHIPVELDFNKLGTTLTEDEKQAVTNLILSIRDIGMVVKTDEV